MRLADKCEFSVYRTSIMLEQSLLWVVLPMDFIDLVFHKYYTQSSGLEQEIANANIFNKSLYAGVL